MSILIKGMDMPRHCGECGIDWCYIWRKLISDETPIGTRPSDCPLVEIPTPHGRLIDADALMKQIEHDTPLSDVFEKTMRRYLLNAPTIISASEE